MQRKTTPKKSRKVTRQKIVNALLAYEALTQLMRSTALTSPHVLADLQPPPPQDQWDDPEVYERLMIWYAAFVRIQEEIRLYEEFVAMHNEAATAIAAYNQMTV